MIEIEVEAIILDNKSLVKDYVENSLLNDNILNEIEQIHNLEIKKIYRNCLVKYGNFRPIEFDVLILAETPTGLKRWISIELKDSDIGKVVEQAVVRRTFVDYSYVVLNVSFKYLVEYLLYVIADYVKEYKVGFFTNDTCILQSKYVKRKIEIKTK